MESAIRFPFDGAAAVDLSPAAAGPYLAGATNGQAFDLANQLASDGVPYWASDDRGFKYLAIVINVTAATVASTETYTFTVQTDNVVGFGGTPVTHLTLTNLGTLADATGPYTLLVDTKTLFKLDPDAKYLRLVMTAADGGGTASIDYTAWAAPLV